MKPWTTKKISALVGIILIINGAVIYLLRNHMFSAILHSGLQLTPNAKSYEIWKDTKTMPMYLDIYIFNWTNPSEINDTTKKPILDQLGPYSFKERREKVNITFHSENNTVSYHQKRTWYFDQSRSNGSLTDVVSQLNVVAVSGVHKIRYREQMLQKSLSYLLNQFSYKINVVKTVDELLFSGFEDRLITMGQIFSLGEEVPPFDRFGWFYMRNGSIEFDGYSNIGTGVDDISNLGVLKKWNYENTTQFYKSPCNVIEGSGGDFWPPNRSTKDDIRLYTPDVCRALTFEFNGKVEHKGIDGYKYAMGSKTLSNDTRRRYTHEQAKYFTRSGAEDFFVADPTIENTDDNSEDMVIVNEGKCFCNGECSPKGVINITACRYGAPGFISLPHFYKGDQVLVDQFVGLEPNEKDHDFYITLEPATGIPIDVAARLQINILLNPSNSFDLFQDVPKLYFPMLWFNVRAGIPDDMVGGLKLLLNIPTIAKYTGLLLICIGSLSLLAAAVTYYLNYRRRLPRNKTFNADTSFEKKTEVVYMDKSAVNDEEQIRTDCQLFPKT